MLKALHKSSLNKSSEVLACQKSLSPTENLASHFMTEVCRLLGIKQSLSTSYHPQTDEQTERTNRTLGEMLRHFVSPSQDDHDLKLSFAKNAVNNAQKAATGYTPFQLNYGRHRRGPATTDVTIDHPKATEFIEKVNAAIEHETV